MEEAVAEHQTAERKTTRRDVGKGLVLLGAVILVLAGVLFGMAVLENDYYGLFSSRVHLVFDLALAVCLIIGGSVLMRPRKDETECGN